MHSGRWWQAEAVASREAQPVTDAASIFQDQLRHCIAQGIAVLEVDDRLRRAKVRVRVDLARAPGSRVIAARPGYRYICRLIVVDDDGTVHDEEIPC